MTRRSDLRPALLLAALLLPGCKDKEPIEPIYTHNDWTDADRIGTLPDFYEKRPKNVLMISVDTFRRDHVGYFGDKDLTPNLDALAAGGVALENHTTCANWTFAGVTCTVRGAYNVDNGFIPRLSQDAQAPIPGDPGTLAGWLSDAGYYTVLHSGNSWFSKLWNNANGFDKVLTGRKWAAFPLAQDGLIHIQEKVLDGTARNGWYLHVHLMEPHAPYVPPSEYIDGISELDPVPWDLTDKDDHYEALAQWPVMDQDTRDLLEKHLRTRYEGELKYWDDQLLQIIADASRRGLLEDTVVVLWNDHGEQFWEHGYQTHAYTLFREENDGWAIFWAPNIVPQAWSGPTVSIDIVPTLLRLLEVDIPPEVTGLPLGDRPDDTVRYGTSVARLGAVQYVRQGDWKLNFNWTGTARLYDLSTDPGETTNLFDPADEKSIEMWNLLEPWVDKTVPLVEDFTPNKPL